MLSYIKVKTKPLINFLNIKTISSKIILIFLVISSLSLVYAADDLRPNIVLLVADDAGFSDFTGFGGEAQTPSMQNLADIGKTFTNFYAMPTCSPSRSTFLTGVDNHLNGLGSMQGQLQNPNNVQVGTPGYKGYLNDQVITVAKLLQDSDYHTYMTGKWHLAYEEDIEEQLVFSRGTWPIDRGFDSSFGMLDGGAEHFGSSERTSGFSTRFFEDDQILVPSIDFAPDYFSSIAHTNKAIEYINAGMAADGNGNRKPFFLYFSDTMPHEPNQLPPGYVKQEYIDLYYAQGWDGIRAQRFQRMIDLGLIPSTLEFPPRVEGYPAWDDETDPNWQVLLDRVTQPPYNDTWPDIETIDDLKWTLAKKMAVYIGMVELFDEQTNRIITHLQSIGEYENTVFFYFSDNGGDPREWDWIDRDLLIHRGVDNSFDNIGSNGSFVSNGREWAQAVNTPLYGAKITMAEGGIRSPFVAAYPGGDIEQASQTNTVATVADIAATILDYAQVTHPIGVGVSPDWDNCVGVYGEASNICPMNGKSMRPVLNGTTNHLHEAEAIGYELFGGVGRDDEGNVIGEMPNKALYYQENGQLWKILRMSALNFGDGVDEPWRLYNLTEDPAESHDLAAEMPQRLAQLIDAYNTYEQNVGFIPQNAIKQTDITPGSQVSYQFQVTNRTADNVSYNINCRTELDWGCTLPTNSLTLAALETAAVEATIDIPETASGQLRTIQINIIPVVNGIETPEISSNQVLVAEVGISNDTGTNTTADDDDDDGGNLLGTSSPITLFLLLLLIAVVRKNKLLARH